MRRVAPSVIAREQLQALLGGGMDREGNIVSALVEVVTGWWSRSYWRASRTTISAAGAATNAVMRDSSGRETVMSRVGCAPPRGWSRSRCRRYEVVRRRFGRC